MSLRSWGSDNSIVDLASLQIRMARSENLPALPQVASHVLKLADDPDLNPREIEKAIEMDPAVTAKLLKVANSSFYGGQRIATLGRAVNFLGLSAVRSVVISIAMQQMVSGRALCPSLNKVEFWRHTFATATACRIIGKLKMPAKAEELYCAGMMHEIGLLAMDKFVPSELNASIVGAQKGGADVLNIERSLLGFDHTDVGAVLAENWGLSGVIQEAISFWRNPLMAKEHVDTTQIVAFSKTMAESLGYKHSGLPGAESVNLMLADAIGLPEAQFGIIGEVVTHEINKAQEMFQIAA